MNNDPDFATVTGQRLVDGVIHQLEHHMMQPRAVIGITDIHAGALAYGIQALEDLDA